MLNFEKTRIFAYYVLKFLKKKTSEFGHMVSEILGKNISIEFVWRRTERAHHLKPNNFKEYESRKRTYGFGVRFSGFCITRKTYGL